MEKPATTEPDQGESLKTSLLLECRAMAAYAFGAGLKVPPAVAEALDAFESPPAGEETPAPKAEPRGKAEASAADQTSRGDISTLAMIHTRLAEVVAPAKPATILLLAEEKAKKGFWVLLGPVPLIRRMMLIAILSLVALVAVSLSELVDGEPQDFSILKNSGTSLLLNELLLLSAASLGASFANLFESHRYIRDGNFDPKYEASYWIRYVLGLIAGTIMALIIPIEMFFSGNQDGASVLGSMQGMEKPVLAILGGFSVRVVYRILDRLMAAVESLVRGDTREIVAAREQTAQARLTEKAVQNRLALSAKLIRLQQGLRSGGDPEELQRELDRIQQGLLFPDSYELDAEDRSTAQPSPPPARESGKP